MGDLQTNDASGKVQPATFEIATRCGQREPSIPRGFPSNGWKHPRVIRLTGRSVPRPPIKSSASPPVSTSNTSSSRTSSYLLRPTLMAMSDTGSSFAHWADLYDYGPSNPTGHVSDHSTSPPTLSDPARPATTTAAAQQQQAGGPLISKTIKKKRPSPRASRRVPVTLLNTDAANFRAMVQQFTGVPGPVVSFASSNDYGYAFQPQPAAVSLDHLQQYTGGAFGYGNALQQQQAAFTAHHGGLGFGSAEDRMLLQSMQQVAAAAQMPSRNGANGYFA